MVDCISKKNGNKQTYLMESDILTPNSSTEFTRKIIEAEMWGYVTNLISGVRELGLSLMISQTPISFCSKWKRCSKAVRYQSNQIKN